MQEEYLKVLGRGEYDVFERLVSEALEPLFAPKVLDSHVAPLRKLAAYEKDRVGELAKVALHCALHKDLRGLRILFNCIPGDMRGYFPVDYLLRETPPHIVAWLLDGFFGQKEGPPRPDACDMLEVACEDKDEHKTRLIMSLLSKEDFFSENMSPKVILAQRDYLLDMVLKNLVATSLFFPRFMDVNERAGADLHTPLTRLFAEHGGARRGLNPNFPEETFFKVAEVLLEKGASPDASDGFQGLTPLMHCRRFPGGVEFLLARGASPDITDQAGRSALLRFSAPSDNTGVGSIGRESLQGIDLLIAGGADRSIKDSEGRNFLYNLVIQIAGFPYRGEVGEFLGRLFGLAAEELAAGREIEGGVAASGILLPSIKSALYLTALSMLNEKDKELRAELDKKLQKSLHERIPPHPLGAISLVLRAPALPPSFSPGEFFRISSALPRSGKAQEEGEDGLGLNKKQSERLIEMLIDALDTNSGAVIAFLSKWAGSDMGIWGEQEYKGIDILAPRLIAHFLPPNAGGELPETQGSGLSL